ncbi:MAG: signal peptide peptidase SppA [Helicobacteraceae bacterium]|jgi:protease-4|nr:signal peptide peptidase SppA [Helicobacteraceae bacterium]
MEDIKKIVRGIAALIGFVQNHFKAVILLLFLLLVFSSLLQQPPVQPNLYRIDLYGPIASADNFLSEIEAANAESIKGVLLVVDSPGGSVSPSVEMMMALSDLAERKPVVAYSAGTMASGSYYASVWASEIVANPGSIIGSIGVMMEGVNAEELLEKIGLKIRVIKAGDYKEAGTFYREWTEDERKQIHQVIDATYDMFVSDVARARGLDKKDAPKFANGKVFTAAQALEVGLIDKIGSITTAQGRLTELSGVKTPVWNEKSMLKKFEERLSENLESALQKSFSSAMKMRLE